MLSIRGNRIPVVSCNCVPVDPGPWLTLLLYALSPTSKLVVQRTFHHLVIMNLTTKTKLEIDALLTEAVSSSRFLGLSFIAVNTNGDYTIARILD